MCMIQKKKLNKERHQVCLSNNMIPMIQILNEQEDINDFEATYENKPLLTESNESDTSKSKDN